MVKLYGWSGTILNADLTSGKIEKQPLSPALARKYLGANGFNAARLFELLKPGIDAFSPENVLLFATGPLAATRALGSGRIAVAAKSPLTDAIGYSTLGGYVGMQLRRAGYDQVVISGKAEHPVYLWINDDRVELRDASHLWGKDTVETEAGIRKELGDKRVQVLCIGLAGENRVRFASIVHSMGAAGRSGMGAVMGSKNLKAIAVKGSQDVPIARPEEFTDICREFHQLAMGEGKTSNKRMHELGSPGLVDLYVGKATSGIGIKNFQTNVFPNWEAISGTTLKKQFTKAMVACPHCPIACKITHRVDSGEFAGAQGHSIEFTFIASMGLGGGIDNLPALIKINELHNRYGMDNASGPYMIVWATDCFERGILTEADTDGIPLRWGDYRAAIKLTHKIAKREGFGNILAEGEKRAPKLVGRGSEKFMYHVKGQSLTGHDPRGLKPVGLEHFTAPGGSHHLTAFAQRMWPVLATTEVGKLGAVGTETMDLRRDTNKGWMVKWCEDITAVVNASGVCIRPVSSAPFDLLRRLLSAAVGMDFTEKELLQTGERIFNLYEAFNAREGLSRQDDWRSVIEKFTHEPIPDGPFQGEVLRLDALLDEYYTVRGWDPRTGRQTRKKLRELGLSHVARELGKQGIPLP